MREEESPLAEELPKRQKFEKLATNRTDKALQYIERLKNLANTDSYDYTPEHVTQMIGALKQKIDEVDEVFQAAMRPKEAPKAFQFSGIPQNEAPQEPTEDAEPDEGEDDEEQPF